MVTYIFVTIRLLITADLFMRRDVFQAIADPTRREIIGMLAQQSLNLNNVADQFSISRPAISRHIKILTECGLVTITQQGRERFCHADVGKLKQVADWTARYQKFWTEKLDALGAFLEQEKLQANDNQ
jgi:DNA-binding transcriptional ArsR family regulator